MKTNNEVIRVDFGHTEIPMGVRGVFRDWILTSPEVHKAHYKASPDKMTLEVLLQSPGDEATIERIRGWIEDSLRIFKELKLPPHA